MAVVRFPCCLVMATALLLLVAGASAQASSNCTTAVTSLSPCVTYVTGTDTAPNLLCCSAIALLNANDADCLCQVVAQLSAATAVNVTKAYDLPAACSVPVDIASCPALPPGNAIAAPPSLLTFPPPPPTVSTPPAPTGNAAAGLQPLAIVAALGVLVIGFVHLG